MDRLKFPTPEWERKESEADRELAEHGAEEAFPDGASFIAALADSAGIGAEEFHRTTG